MSYLSQFIVTQKATRDFKLWDSYAWHRTIWNLFPGMEDENRDFLFRVDAFHTHTRLLLLSPSPPRLPEWGAGRTKQIRDNFLHHGTYRFQVKANPTRRLKESRKRIGLRADEDLRKWLTRKGEIAGFAVSPSRLSIQPPMDAYFTREGKKGKHISVDFSGILKVTDRHRFQDAFYTGIGTAKAFGYGMLMLQPV
ncbi:MAG: type I-E CRISPR-associated protein Cas6/Cse3/CasE [Desulfatitalea sp.]|nr:type I-E CRISPR-associated protein Cas6/Cse3/CasE [Desulfatitalea sp.]